MRHAIMSVLILTAIGAGPATAQTSAPNAGPPTVPVPATPAAPGNHSADVSPPHNGVIKPVPGTSSDAGATVHPPNVDPGINVAPPGIAGDHTPVVPK
jgi:hypothetical protein